MMAPEMRPLTAIAAIASLVVEPRNRSRMVVTLSRLSSGSLPERRQGQNDPFARSNRPRTPKTALKLRRFSGRGAFAGLQETDIRAFSADIAELPIALGQDHRSAVAVFGHLALVRVAEFFHVLGRAAEPARGLVGRGFEIDIEPVFGVQTALQDIELKLPDDADRPLRADQGLEHLRHALLGQALERALQVLGL